jgi:hypothetical protein
MAPQYVDCQNIDEGTFCKPTTPAERSLCEYQGVGCVQTNRHGVIHPHFEPEGAAMKKSLIDDSRPSERRFGASRSVNVWLLQVTWIADRALEGFSTHMCCVTPSSE